MFLDKSNNLNCESLCQIVFKLAEKLLKRRLFKRFPYIYIYIYIYIYTAGYSESTEPIDAVNILPLARFEPTTSTTPPSTTPDIDATNCATETSPKKDVQEALILTTPDAVVCRILVLFQCMASISFASESLMDPRIQVKFDKYQK